jgi:hypothetical protein
MEVTAMLRLLPALVVFPCALAASDGRASITLDENNRFLPQLVFGGGWRTTVTLMNFDPFSAPVQVEFFATDGSPLRVPLEGIGTFDRLTVNVAGNGVMFLETPGDATGELAQGWARFHYPSGVKVGGAAILRQSVAGRPDFETAIPFTSDIRIRSGMVFDNTAGYTTAVAMVNPRDRGTIDVVVHFRDSAGGPIVTDAFTLQPREHRAYELRSRTSAIANRRGFAEFRVSGAGGFAYLGLLFNSSGAVTTMFSMAP